jgi:hypothetical protein
MQIALKVAQGEPTPTLILSHFLLKHVNGHITF